MRRLLLPLALLPLLTSCSYSHDGYFQNLCDKSLTIRTFYVVWGTQDKSEDVIAVAVIPPHAVTKVEDAFQDAAGFTWWVEVSGQPAFKVSEDTMPEWKVTIPTFMC